MPDRLTVLLPTSYPLVSHDDPRAAAYGVTCCVLEPDVGQTLTLEVTAPKDQDVSAHLIWRRRVREITHEDRTIKVDDVCLSQIVGATDVTSAIRAVEEAAVIAGWARRA